MSVPAVGRGAWSKIGKDNGSRWYEHIAGQPLDGSGATRDVNYQAVNLGVRAIQARINALGFASGARPPLVVDGLLGRNTKAGIEWVQQAKGLRVDGKAGPATCRALWHGLIGGDVPPRHLWGMMLAESVADPGAVGATTPSDRGLVQINLDAHPTITVEQAFDPTFALPYTASRLAAARLRYAAKGPELQTSCSIAQHNAPAWADAWYATGQAPNDLIASYVARVLELGQGF
jgi:hypothetical protein